MAPTESSASIFNNNEVISNDELTITTGGSEAIQELVKNTASWDGSSPVAAVGITINADGDVTMSEVFLMGTKDGTKIDATVLFGGERHENDCVKISSISLADFLFKGSLVSEWIDNNDFTWVYRKYNPDTGRYKEIQHLDEPGMKSMNISKLFMRCHLTVIPGPKLQVRIGVAPCEDIENMAGHDAQNFPFISINKEFNATLIPEEPDQANWGLGLAPFIIHNQRETPPLPNSMTIKQTVAGLMKNVVKPTSKTKHRTWVEVAGAAHWEEIPTNYSWPDPQPENNEEAELGMY